MINRCHTNLIDATRILDDESCRIAELVNNTVINCRAALHFVISLHQLVVTTFTDSVMLQVKV